MDMDMLLDMLQWPAMGATLVAAWLVGCQTKRERSWGFLLVYRQQRPVGDLGVACTRLRIDPASVGTLCR